MKQELNNSRVYLEQEELNKLVSEVKETIATDIKHTENKNNFSAADLWNIQKSRKAYQGRRTLWN